jgi:hydroxypyruvate isomerase
MAEPTPLRYSVCLETMFLDLPFEQRMEHAVAHGFSAFEFWSRDGKDMNITQALKLALRVDVSAFIGSTVPLVDESQYAAFESDIVRAASLAVDISCPNLIVYSGPALSGVPREKQHENIVNSLTKVLPVAKDAGVTLVLEPQNPIDHPGSYLTGSDEGFQIIREVNNPHVRLLFSAYHQQISEGNLSARIHANIDLIGYIHAADVPGRREPGMGEINYKYIFALLRKLNYRGYIGLEYKPILDSSASLKAMRAITQ